MINEHFPRPSLQVNWDPMPPGYLLPDNILSLQRDPNPEIGAMASSLHQREQKILSLTVDQYLAGEFDWEKYLADIRGLAAYCRNNDMKNFSEILLNKLRAINNLVFRIKITVGFLGLGERMSPSLFAAWASGLFDDSFLFDYINRPSGLTFSNTVGAKILLKRPGTSLAIWSGLQTLQQETQSAPQDVRLTNLPPYFVAISGQAVRVYRVSDGVLLAFERTMGIHARNSLIMGPMGYLSEVLLTSPAQATALDRMETQFPGSTFLGRRIVASPDRRPTTRRPAAAARPGSTGTAAPRHPDNGTVFGQLMQCGRMFKSH